jgi:hypothetical protein
MADYKAYQLAVCNELVNTRLKLYFLFNGWTTHSGKYLLTSVYIHHLNREGRVVDYLIALPEQLGCYTRINYAAVISDVLAHFKVTKESLGYFITDNARNNNTCLDYLATVFNFKKDDWCIQCAAYTLNLIT